MTTKNLIIHGDSRDYIPKIKTPINCIITDPPFGIDYRSNSAVLPKSRAANQKIHDDDSPEKAVKTFHSIFASIIPKLADQAEIYIFTSWIVLDHWIPAVKNITHLDCHTGEVKPWIEHNISLKMMLIWSKDEPGQGDIEANWGCGHEIILYLKKGRRPLPFRRSGILHHNKIPAGQNIHETEKPVGLLEPLILASTDKDDLIVDPYSGSGSTSVAAQKLGRNSLAFEINERYIQPSRDRLKQTSFNLD